MTHLPFPLRAQYRVTPAERAPETPPRVPADEMLPTDPGYLEGPIPPTARLGVVVKEDRPRFGGKKGWLSQRG
jgi:hypothetical protein